MVSRSVLNGMGVIVALLFAVSSAAPAHAAIDPLLPMVRRRTAEAGVSQLNHSSVDDSFALYRRESTPGGSGKECSVTTVVDLIDVQEIGGKQCNLI